STDVKKQKFEAKENPKVIFYSLLIIISILAGSAYSYIKVAKKLIYEIKLSKKLDSELSKNIFKKDTVIGSWLGSLQGGRDENK
ncbi:MAG: iron transport-associated domain protein, partial [Peptostreptococcus sp.]|nr:iron transport-associated domain protein [Peptostreptococcus sp.]